jgi:hypothetical protein
MFFLLTYISSGYAAQDFDVRYNIASFCLQIVRVGMLPRLLMEAVLGAAPGVTQASHEGAAWLQLNAKHACPQLCQMPTEHHVVSFISPTIW